MLNECCSNRRLLLIINCCICDHPRWPVVAVALHSVMHRIFYLITWIFKQNVYISQCLFQSCFGVKMLRYVINYTFKYDISPSKLASSLQYCYPRINTDRNVTLVIITVLFFHFIVDWICMLYYLQASVMSSCNHYFYLFFSALFTFLSFLPNYNNSYQNYSEGDEDN